MADLNGAAPYQMTVYNFPRWPGADRPSFRGKYDLLLKRLSDIHHHPRADIPPKLATNALQEVLRRRFDYKY